MKSNSSLKKILPIFLALFFVGCASNNAPRQIYYWDGSYTGAVYEYINENGDSYAQIAALENLVQKAYERNAKVPPGVFAHLGLLYSNQSNMSQAKAYFDKEIQNFPESKAYITFLIEQSKTKKAAK